MSYRIPNPGVCGGWKPVELISDRAKRYRANNSECKPKGPKVCAYCRSRKNVEVHHEDGNEDNGKPSNLAYACKSCNAKIAAFHKKNGLGKRIRQNNPKAARKVPTFEQYAYAVATHTRGTHDEAGAVIHATPKALRTQYAQKIWDRRRARGTTSTRSVVPF